MMRKETDIDLNLLTAFKLIMADGSVSFAARKMGVTQSAMSHILNRLRKQFNDPLFVKSSSGMLPTQRAIDLYSSIALPLQELQQALDKQTKFDPSSSTKCFNLATSDYFEAVMFPKLMSAISQVAPNVQIKCRPLADEELSSIGTSIDLAFGHYQDAPDNFKRKTLWHESFVTIASQNHARIANSLSLNQFLDERHVVISPSGYGRAMVDRKLHELGKKRQVGLYTASFTTPVIAVAHSNMLATVPKRLTLGYEKLVKVFPPPIDILGFDFHMIWSQLSQNDPANQWLRSIIETARLKL